MYGTYPKCVLGPRTDAEWVVGLAVWKDLTDRRGVKNELLACDEEIQVEIIETMGKIAVKSMKEIK